MNLVFNIIAMTVTGSVVFALFKGMECFTKRYFSAAWHYGIMKCIMLFFCIPIGLFSDNFVSRFISWNAMASDYSAQKHGLGIISRMLQTIEGASEIIAAIWMSGAVILFVRQIIFYLKFRYIIKNNQKAADKGLLKLANACGKKQGIGKAIRLYINEYINTPMLTGIVSPVIILPAEIMDMGNAEYILNHELTHYKRKDLLIKYAMIVIRILHWFNPFIYQISNTLDKWCEYACDERNAVELSLEMKKRYGLAILDAAVSAPVTGSGFGTPLLMPKQNLKDRLMFMLNVKKMKKKAIAFSFVLTVGLISFGFVAALAAEAGNKIQDEVNRAMVSMNVEKGDLTYQASWSAKLLTGSADIEKGYNILWGDKDIKY